MLLQTHSSLPATVILLLASVIFAQTQPKSSMMAGGWTDQSVDDKDVKELAGRAVTKMNSQSNDMHYMFPVQIVSAKSQVVQGTQYELKILVGKSSCKKNEVGAAEFDATKCQETSENDRKTITARIWSKPWENFESIEFVTDQSNDEM